MRLNRIVTLAGLTCMFATAAAAAQPSVLITAAASTTVTNCRFTDVQAKLIGTGLFSSVDIFDAYTATPTLAELQQYDVVLTWSNNTYQSAAALGDVLADYVDAGGGVVVAVFANTGGWRLGGRWINEGYETIIGTSNSVTGFASLGTVHDPSHPIMAGVTSFDGGTSSFRPSQTLLGPGSTSIADWSDGLVLIAEGPTPNNIGLGFYPPSSDCSPGFWTSTTDGALLMANALVYASGGGHTPCYADCDGNEVLNIDDFLCFINEFAQAQGLPVAQQITHYANCDGSTSIPTLTIDDFLCFINEFAQGCP